MKTKIFYKIIFVVSCIVFIICALLLIKMYIPSNSDSQEYTNNTGTEFSDSTTISDNPIDFSKLQAVNPDVYAWIKIPDTNIDYAVAQSSADKDDLFYLNHNIDGDYEFSGMIFSQKKNSLDFTDPVTVLYGHNMKNGSMFSNLHKFKDSDFFNKHKNIYIYTPEHILTYTIVSAYVYDDRHILNTFDFTKKADLKEYIDSITNPRSVICNVRDDVPVSIKDKILTLSTCTSSDSQRYLVQGVLTSDEITN
jgi:sortase B